MKRVNALGFELWQCLVTVKGFRKSQISYQPPLLIVNRYITYGRSLIGAILRFGELKGSGEMID